MHTSWQTGLPEGQLQGQGLKFCFKAVVYAHLTERQGCQGSRQVVAFGHRQKGHQDDQAGPDEVQAQAEPLVSSLQAPVRPAWRRCWLACCMTGAARSCCWHMQQNSILSLARLWGSVALSKTRSPGSAKSCEMLCCKQTGTIWCSQCLSCSLVCITQVTTQAGHHKTSCCCTSQKLLQRRQGIPPVVEVNLVIRLHGELLLKTIGPHSLHPCQGF